MEVDKVDKVDKVYKVKVLNAYNLIMKKICYALIIILAITTIVLLIFYNRKDSIYIEFVEIEELYHSFNYTNESPQYIKQIELGIIDKKDEKWMIDIDTNRIKIVDEYYLDYVRDRYTSTQYWFLLNYRSIQKRIDRKKPKIFILEKTDEGLLSLPVQKVAYIIRDIRKINKIFKNPVE
ncbi:MAG: hypothetical protein JW965_11110 [Bacteroidales bacterium]|nr:hypothetical protein [Bacteroidales bacterium]